MRVDTTRLVDTLDRFPPAMRVAVEVRHPSWDTDEVRTILTDRQVALCLADRRGPLQPLWRTASWGYLRFHDGRAHPRPCYGQTALDTWARRIAEYWTPRTMSSCTSTTTRRAVPSGTHVSSLAPWSAPDSTLPASRARPIRRSAETVETAGAQAVARAAWAMRLEPTAMVTLASVPSR